MHNHIETNLMKQREGCIKKEVSMIRKYHNQTLQINPRHCEEELKDTSSNRGHPKDNKSKATSTFFLVKIIAKLERTQSNANQNKDQHRTPTNNERYIK